MVEEFRLMITCLVPWETVALVWPSDASISTLGRYATREQQCLQ